jgi:hypothetical protein
VNLMQLDAGRIESLVTSLHPMWDSLLQIVGYSTLLWFVLGPCAFAGFAIMASLIPINTLIFKRLSAYRQQMLRQVYHFTVTVIQYKTRRRACSNSAVCGSALLEVKVVDTSKVVQCVCCNCVAE